MVGAREGLAGDNSAIQSEHNMEPAVCLHVESAAWIGDRRAKLEGILCAGDPGCIAIEAVEIGRSANRIARGVKNSQNVVDGFHNKAIPLAQALVRWFDRELVSAGGDESLLEMVQPVDREAQFRVGFGFCIT